MPLTAPELLKAVNDAGIDTPEKAAAFFGRATDRINKDALQRQLSGLQLRQQADAAKIEAERQRLQGEIAAIDAKTAPPA